MVIDLFDPSHICTIFEIFCSGCYDGLHLRRNDKVLDVGANIGAFTIKAATSVRNGQVIAIEPDPRNLNLLKQNVELNKLDNVKIVPSAVSDKNEKRRFFLSRGSGWSSFFDSSLPFIQFSCETIDSILGHLGIECIDCLKMDVEGAELLALKGAKRTLENVREIILETHFGQKEQINNFLEKKGFRTYAPETKLQLKSKRSLISGFLFTSTLLMTLTWPRTRMPPIAFDFLLSKIRNLLTDQKSEKRIEIIYAEKFGARS